MELFALCAGKRKAGATDRDSKNLVKSQIVYYDVSIPGAPQALCCTGLGSHPPKKPNEVENSQSDLCVFDVKASCFSLSDRAPRRKHVRTNTPTNPNNSKHFAKCLQFTPLEFRSKAATRRLKGHTRIPKTVQMDRDANKVSK